MEKLILEIEAYAKAVGRSPSTILQRAKSGSGDTWRRWKDGGRCGLEVADRVRQYIADNPPPAPADTPASERPAA